MTQLPQDEFETSLEKAESWMKEIHEQLKQNDNTQGPRSALESRLRETEKICSLEGDGKLLIDKVLMKAEVLLSESREEEKHEIHLKLARIKGLFEETTTYMIHCHSRIEWVWLHWNEYLRARDEFTLWIHNITLTLEPDVELQLGMKEKRWQYEQAVVLMKDVLNQSLLVDRLLEEAASLYNRIGDSSVDESVQSAIMAEYIQIKKKAQERVERLEKIWKDHEAYEGDVNGFKSWLNTVIEKLKFYVGAASDSSENRLDMLQEINKDVESGNKQLGVLDVKSAQVIMNTSPLGAEKICKELEELRKTLKELKQMNDEEEETLLKTHNSENAFLLLAQQLEANINEFRKATQRLEESLESGERVKSEDDLIALWKTLNATKSALAAEEAKAERVKVQLRDLFKFSKDVQPLSDGVISAMRDYQRAKSKAFKLSTDTESELRQLFQNPLREFLYWKPIAESVLDATAVPLNDGAMNRDALDNIEKLREESCTIKDKLAALEKKKERIHLVLGKDKTMTLLQDIAVAEKEREAIHQDLLQRKISLQTLTEQRKEFDSAFKTLHHKISAIRVKSIRENELQADIIGKEAQIQRLQILLEELIGLNSPIQELISMTESNSTHAHRAERLTSDYLTLQRSLENKIRKNKENINNHRLFSQNLQDLQHWIIVTHQKLESYRNGGKNWRERDVETLKVELSGKEIQRHLVEAQGQNVIETSSPEGAALIQSELKHLNDSLESLQQLFEQMARGVKEREQHKSSPKSLQKPITITQTSSLVSDMDTDDLLQSDKTPTHKRTSASISQDGQVIHFNSLDDFSTDGSPRNRGFRQIGGSARTSYNVMANTITDVPESRPGYDKLSEVLGHKKNSHSTDHDTSSISTREKGDRDSRLGIQDKKSSVSFPGRSKIPRKKSATVKRIDGASSVDHSGYEFRIIDQEDGSQEDEKSERLDSSPGRSKDPGNKSAAVKRIDGASSIDRSGYEFRIIDQEDGSQEDEKSERLGSLDRSGYEFRIIDQREGSKEDAGRMGSSSGRSKNPGNKSAAVKRIDGASSVDRSGYEFRIIDDQGDGSQDEKSEKPGSSPGRSKNPGNKSAAVKRIDGASSVDRSGYEFRIIDQVDGSKEDEKSGRLDSSSGRSKNSGNKSAAVKRIDGASSIDRSGFEFRIIDQEDEKTERLDSSPGRSKDRGNKSAAVKRIDGASSIDHSGYGFRIIDQEDGSKEDEKSGRLDSFSGRSKNPGNKSAAVKRIDGASSIDRIIDHSDYEFRSIDQGDGGQEDEKSGGLGSADTDGHSFRSIGNTEGSKKNICISRELGQIDKRGGGYQDVNGLSDSGDGDAQGHELNSGSVRVSSLDYRTSPSHTPSKSNKSPAMVRGGLTTRTSLQQDAELHHKSGFQISPGKLQISSGFMAEENMNKKIKSPNNPGTSRRNQKFVSLAESVDIVDSPNTQRTGGHKADDDHMRLLLEFEQWLQAESSKLNRICADRNSGSDAIKTRQSHLQNLQLRVPQGQKLFKSLLHSRSSMTVTEDLKLEELRYLWMLYKSKLRDSGKHSNLKIAEEPRGVTKASRGICSYLHRVCCAALPLQLLLLLLLLLAFLLPLLHETKNCALSNNFARSFNLMLKYNGPPPT